VAKPRKEWGESCLVRLFLSLTSRESPEMRCPREQNLTKPITGLGSVPRTCGGGERNKAGCFKAQKHLWEILTQKGERGVYFKLD